jgi:Ni2+-binding GTPase involved in maturation of urease and hydrogenase
MANEPTRILLTGAPGSGKTTAVMKIIGALHGARIAGFYTEEIPEADDVLDALAAAWTAVKAVIGQAATLPEHPASDLRMEILRPVL